MAVLVLGLAGALAMPVVTATASAPQLDYNLSTGAQPGWWGTNGRVTDIVSAGGRVYIAGGFDYVGPSTGYGVGVNARTGAMLPGAPLVDGTVATAVADGSGGWYIGGAFTHVAGVYRPGAAQITAKGSVTAWNPRPKGPVYAIAVTGSSVILGGNFSQLGSTPVTATRLGAVDRVNGAAVPGWSASANAPVRALAVTGRVVFAGGDFTTVRGLTHHYLAKLSTTNGGVYTSFRAGTSTPIRALALSPNGSVLYGGGSFGYASNGWSSYSRSRVAAWATSTGGLTTWAPQASSSVNALAVDPNNGTIYLGGFFGMLGRATRVRLGSVTAAGAVTAFNPNLNGCNIRHSTGNAHTNPACTPEVDALALDGGSLYVGGRFSGSGSTSRHDAAAFSTSTGALTGWDPVAGDRVQTVAPSDTAVFMGGDLTSVNGVVRKGIAALDAKTGKATSFRADTSNEVLDLQLSPDDSRLYLGGSFLSVQGQARTKVASIVTSTGLLDASFKPSFNNDVLALGYGGGALYAVGQFTLVNGWARTHAVKLSPSTGLTLSTFTANTSGPGGNLRQGGMVQSLAVKPDGSMVFLGGPFTTVNGRALPNGIAVVSGVTGALYGNQLGGVQKCTGYGPWIVDLHLSADGKRLYGGDVCPDFIYQWDAVNLSSSTNSTGLNWRTTCDGGMQAALEVNGNFYYGTHGSYCRPTPTSTTKVLRQRYAVFDATSAQLQPDAPAFNSPMGIWSFAEVPQGLLVGGDFTWANDPTQVQQGLVLFTGTP